MRLHVASVAALLALVAVSPAGAQQRVRPEIRPFVGAYLPTGTLRDHFKTATTVGTQVAFEMSRNFHILGTVGWTNGHNKFAAMTNDATYIWQYDAGVELNLVQEFGDGWLFRPLIGAGGGARTYDYQEETVGTKTFAAGYGALGAELEKGVLAFRLEGRAYMTSFESPITAVKKTRNDIGVSFGLAYHLR